MQSLFTRVFASFWIAIVCFVLAATTLTAINFRAEMAGPQRIAQQAQAELRERGLDGLRAWVRSQNAADGRRRILVIDRAGREILDQPLPARRFGHHPPPDGVAPSPGVADEAAPPPPPPPAEGGGAAAPLSDGDFPLPHHVVPPPFRHFPAVMHVVALDGTAYALMIDPPPKRGLFVPPFSATAQAILLAMAVLISGLVSYLLARSITRPLVGLQDTARALADGDLAARTPPAVAARSDEIGTLAREFDAMAERIASLVSARQQLLRDLSHELRSPLARLQMAVSLLRQQAAGDERQLARIDLESERLEALVAQIIDYARLERDPATLERQEFDLAELVRGVVHDAEFETQSPPGRIRLTAEPSQAVPLRGDAAVLHAAIDNVVRNALLHGGDGAVELAIECGAAETIVTVSDLGPGVPESDLERIFEPFYRVARPAGERSPVGSGIGLAVAAKAVQLHGGRIVATNRQGGGLRVSIALPQAR